MRDSPHWPDAVLVAAAAIALLVVYLLLAAIAAHAAPPPGADPDSPRAQWFRSLTVPSTGMPCCSIADCRTTAWRMRGDHYEAFIGRAAFGHDAPDAWRPVAADHVLHRTDNPTGEAVACWWRGVVLCLVPGSAS